MRLSRRSEYGLRALVDLVRHDGEGPVALNALAARNNLPTKFLEQIMATLKHGGVVRTTLGAHGGYALAARPETVSIGRVVRLLDGALAPLPCVSLRYYEPCSCPDEATCSLRDVMIDVRDDARDPRQGDPRGPRRAHRTRLDRPARHPRRRPGRSPAVTERRRAAVDAMSHRTRLRVPPSAGSASVSVPPAAGRGT